MKISNQHLAIGVPCTFPFIPSSFFYSFVMMEKPESYSFIHADNGPIDTLRNDIVDQALDIGASHLIFMDVDQIYHPKTITSLLAHRLPVVGAAVCRRYPPFDPIILELKNGAYAHKEEWNPDGLVECDATGSGCLMFEMSIFRKMPKPWFRFQKHEATGLTIGEDVGFCQDLKAAGYKIFVDCSVHAGHLTTMVINRTTHLLWKSMKEKQHQENMKMALLNDKPKAKGE